MANVETHVCDRCRREFDSAGPGSRRSITLTVNYHHPKTLELCDDCEGEFTIWLGRHPLWGTPMDDILNGLAQGEGYPNKDQLERERERRAR